MRHQCRVPQLGRPADQRKAMLRGLTTQLIREGRVTTTKARAKAQRDEAERKISLSFKGQSLDLFVPPTANIVKLGPADRALIVVGAPAQVIATQGAAGLTAARVTIAVDGAKLPM